MIQESVVVGGTGAAERKCIITVLGITGAKVRLGFEVAADVPVHRLEVWKRIKAEIEHDRAGGNAPAGDAPLNLASTVLK
jgi:sRNA-binding carbon storage regulator CsrA